MSAMNEPIRELREIVRRHATTSRRPTALKGLSLYRVVGTTAPADTMYRPALCYAVSGRKKIVFGGDVYAYDETSYLIATLDVPVRGCVIEASEAQPFLGLVLDLDIRRIAELLLDVPPPAVSTARDAGVVAGRMDGDLLEALTRYVRLLDRPDDAHVLAPLIEREIYYRLLRGERGVAIREAATAGSHLAAIARAASWIALHYAEPFSIDELAAMADMSVTSFNRHFKAITAHSPLQYRTQVRLQEARRKLAAGGLDAASIGLEIGYESPSQFSREYRRMFGTSPGADAARLRLAAR